MASNFHVTYEIVTHESAEHGDAAERGFICGDGWYHALPDHVCGHTAGAIKDANAMTLRDAMRYCFPQEDSSGCFSEIDGRRDYKTGAEERRSLHPPESITAASYGRVARLLKL